MVLIRIVSDVPPSLLDSSINNVVTSLNVTSGDGTNFGAAPFQIAIGEEAMLVTSVATDTFTVVRGYADTANVGHTAGDDLVHAHTHLDFPFRRDDTTGDYQILGSVDLDLNSQNIIGLLDPSSNQHAATKNYVDTAHAGTFSDLMLIGA